MKKHEEIHNRADKILEEAVFRNNKMDEDICYVEETGGINFYESCIYDGREFLDWLTEMYSEVDEWEDEITVGGTE